MEPRFPVEQLPADGKWGINSWFCFPCMHSFRFTYQILFVSIHEFAHFYPSDSLPHPIVGSEIVTLCGIVVSLGLNRNM